MFVDVIESPLDAASYHVVEGVWELDGSGTKVDVDAAALSYMGKQCFALYDLFITYLHKKALST